MSKALLLGELEQQLRSISHSEEEIQAVQAFSNGLAGTKVRLEVWNAANAILRKPIEYGETAALGFDTPDDQFTYCRATLFKPNPRISMESALQVCRSLRC